MSEYIKETFSLTQNQYNLIIIAFIVIIIQVGIYFYMNPEKTYKWRIAILLVIMSVIFKYSNIKILID